MHKKNVSRCAITLALTGFALTGCETKNQGAVYWSEKDGAVTVHHVTGKTDQSEKLIRKPFKDDRLGDGSFYQVTNASTPFTVKAKGDSKLETKVANLTAKVESLEEKLRNRSETKQEPDLTKKIPIDIRNAQASGDRPDPRPTEPEPDEPRLSQ